MRETTFIEQNQKKWQEFEHLLEGQVYDPEKLNELFVQVTDDLSYARTFYPNRSVRVYLNGLSQKIFFNIYKNKKSRRSNFIEFWTEDLPRLIYDARFDLRISLFIFSLAMIIGMLSCWAEPDFLKTILGADYVQMTEANIKSGDPMAVYKEAGEFNMFLGITLNNILVAFRTFILGIIYGIGTIGMLIYNGVMLGAFQFFFIEKGLFRESFLAVWLHGSFEISSIVIAGAAGLTMGRGLVFPGTFTRERSFQLAARRGLSLMVGVVPLFIFAGFTESYLTRHTEAPDWLRALFIFICFAIVIFYFAIYPRSKARKGLLKEEDVRLTPDVDRRVDFTPVKSSGELFTDSFIFLRKCLRPIGLAAMVGSAIFCIGAFLLAETQTSELFFYEQGWFGIMQTIPSFFKNPGNAYLFPFAVLALSLVTFITQLFLKRWRNRTSNGTDFDVELPKPRVSHLISSFLQTSVVVTVYSLIFLLPGWAAFFLNLLLFPIFFLLTQVIIFEGGNIFKSIGRTGDLMMTQFGQMMGLYVTMFITGLLFFLIFDSGLLWFLLDVIGMNFYLTDASARSFDAVAITGISMFVLLLIFGLWTASSGLQYFSILEANEAFFLKKRLELIGKRDRIRGLDREA
ncbi:MAG: hypothetical protein GC192_06605 [Bacteroidetes bacterium]|nr:hypothetical protein [Bacteroidota bacterium]